ncbi:MAG: prolyl-tRNA synthetase associated domain-containing protein [bacterium]|nr:prolyl-tRNA synthetase associated domain-containing protein [bacterium]
MNPSQTTKDLLHQLSIEFQEFTHPPVFTCEEAERLCPPMPGKKNKNLFLRDAKGKKYFLFSLAQDKRLSIQQMADIAGEKSLSFASERRLKEVLGIEPGSVGILALINDTQKLTTVFIDSDLLDPEWFQSHPLINTSTWCLKSEDVPRFLSATGHHVIIIEN